MTEQKHHPVSGNNRLLAIILLTALVIVGSWVSYFLATFDLNDYRKEVESRLSTMLSLTVKLGEMRYELHGSNLALDVAGVQIGDQSSRLEIKAPEMTIDLKWLDLLQRDFSISTISLTRPAIEVRGIDPGEDTAPGSAVGNQPLLIDQGLLYSTRIDALSLTEGYIQISHFDESKENRITLKKINGDIKNIVMGSMAQFSVEGELTLPGQINPSHWQLQGGAALTVDENRGLTPRLDLDIQCRALQLQRLHTLFRNPDLFVSMSGEPDVELQIKGDYSQQIDFQIEVAAKNGVSLTPGGAYEKPIEFDFFTASGQLQIASRSKAIRNLSLQVDDSRLAGEWEWERNEDLFRLSANLVNSKLTVPQLKQWIPNADEKFGALTNNLEDQGIIVIQSARATYSNHFATSPVFTIEELVGELQNIVWPFDNAPSLEIISMPFNINEDSWEIATSGLQMGSMRVSANGQGEYDPESLYVTSLDFSGDVLPKDILDEWYVPRVTLTTEGKIAVDGHLEGPLDKLAIDFRADLSHLSLNHPAGLKLDPDKGDRLILHATVSPGKISLDHGSIKWSAAKGHIRGSYLPGDPESLAIEALLSIADLTRIAESLPLLEKLELKGQADLGISQKGDPETNPPAMMLTLRDAGMKATRYIANLNRINGRIKVEPTGLQAEDLSVQLGESLFTVDAKLTDFTNPQLVLDVSSPTVRARDIVFYSDSALLRDVNGRLEINRKGLTFTSVKTHLDQGTDASVSGTINFTPPYGVHLDIASEQAIISEVISLWTGGSRDKKRARRRASIVINAQIKNGDLYGMKFRDATGVIRPSRNSLIIHPLDFSVGEGYCNAQVITEFHHETPSILRISGHAEDVDALEVYRELLNQRSIVRGKLRGDFYLSGEIGSHYLPSSYGRFNVQIQDGVLHEFPILSKIFSLLNVSQIFALQVPDMNLEGMPFNNLSGNFRLDSGILASDDLTIQSEAMNQSYIGQLNLINKEIDLTTSIHPLGTIDKIVSRIPIAGWLLTGEDEALLTAHFRITGKTESVKVQPLPLDTIAEPTIGLLRRALNLPFKLFEDPQILWGGHSEKGE